MFQSEAQYLGSVVFGALYWAAALFVAWQLGATTAVALALVGTGVSWVSAYAGHAYAESDNWWWAALAILTLSGSVALALATGWIALVGLVV